MQFVPGSSHKTSVAAALTMQTEVKLVGQPNDLKGISILHAACCMLHIASIVCVCVCVPKANRAAFTFIATKPYFSYFT